MKDTLKNLLIKLLKPTLYYVERNSFVGDFVVTASVYLVNTDNTLTFKDPADGVEKTIALNKTFLLYKNAKKEAAKSILPINIENARLLKVLIEQGIKLKEYEKQQILEDGEASEVYQNLTVGK